MTSTLVGIFAAVLTARDLLMYKLVRDGYIRKPPPPRKPPAPPAAES